VTPEKKTQDLERPTIKRRRSLGAEPVQSANGSEGREEIGRRSGSCTATWSWKKSKVSSKKRVERGAHEDQVCEKLWRIAGKAHGGGARRNAPMSGTHGVESNEAHDEEKIVPSKKGREGGEHCPEGGNLYTVGDEDGIGKKGISLQGKKPCHPLDGKSLKGLLHKVLLQKNRDLTGWEPGLISRIGGGGGGGGVGGGGVGGGKGKQKKLFLGEESTMSEGKGLSMAAKLLAVPADDNGKLNDLEIKSAAEEKNEKSGPTSAEEGRKSKTLGKGKSRRRWKLRK